MLSLPDIELLFARHGDNQYCGEPVTQRQHALQTAHFAEQSGADDEFVTACLLHDLGHLLNDQGGGLNDTPSLRGINDTHQYAALPFLRGLFGAAVLDAIRLHVDAKRTLCHANPGYAAKLSDDSKRSLALQGGVFDAAQAGAFLQQGGAHQAVMLRQWDELAKQAGGGTGRRCHDRLVRHRAVGHDARAGGLGGRAARNLGAVRGAARCAAAQRAVRRAARHRHRRHRGRGHGAALRLTRTVPRRLCYRLYGIEHTS